MESKSDLHLATSIRSFRSENVSKLVKELLDLELGTARETLGYVQTFDYLSLSGMLLI